MQTIVKHKFKDHQLSENSSILILGTFNPDSKDNEAEFFYGRPRNHMWTLLPKMFNENSLKNATVEKKKEFILRHSIDFLDLIEAVEVEQVLNYNDSYIDSRVLKWRNVIEVISNLKSLKRVYFTRKTFSGIPNMQKRIEEIQRFCLENDIKFYFLPTPARFTNEAKISEWHNLFKP